MLFRVHPRWRRCTVCQVCGPYRSTVQLAALRLVAQAPNAASPQRLLPAPPWRAGKSLGRGAACSRLPSTPCLDSWALPLERFRTSWEAGGDLGERGTAWMGVTSRVCALVLAFDQVGAAGVHWHLHLGTEGLKLAWEPWGKSFTQLEKESLLRLSEIPWGTRVI